MIEKKRLLINEAFEKAKKDLPRGSKTSIASYLSSLIEEKFDYKKDERTFVRYYKSLVEENTDYNIDDITLDYLSEYLGYSNFENFCDKVSTQKLVDNDKPTVKIIMPGDEKEETIKEKINNIIINITNQPIFTISKFISENTQSLGLVGVMIVGGFLMNKTDVFKGKEEIKGGYGIVGTVPERMCMYWDETEYKLTNCNDKNPNHEVLPIDSVKLKYFKKITRPDTLTANNTLGKLWYSKYKNKVEFFTMDGKNPENGKELDEVSEYILEKYAKK